MKPLVTIAAERTIKELEKLEIKNAQGYLGKLYQIGSDTRVTLLPLLSRHFPHNLKEITLNDGFDSAIAILKDGVIAERKRLMFVGNGGSAAIASHMLMDYLNAGNVRTTDFTSPALLTCMANDYGWDNVFSTPIEKSADQGDILIAISSSGQSRNILNACDAADKKGCTIITFSGMSENNPLRTRGHLNFYVPSTHYGFIELSHEAFLHGILDLFLRNAFTKLSD